MAVKKLKTSRQICNEDSTSVSSKRTLTPQQAFEIAKREVFRDHAGLFRRLAEHYRQQDGKTR